MWSQPVPNYSGRVADPAETAKILKGLRSQKIQPFVEVPAVQSGKSAFSGAPSMPSKRTTEPIVTGSSILAIRFAGGVMLAADTLGSYGRLAMFESFQRIRSVAPGTLIAGGGDLSDFQQIMKMLGDMANRDFCHDDGHHASAAQFWSYLTRVMYQRRMKGDPLWNQVVLAGVSQDDGKPFLGFVDLRGTAYQEDIVATGYGAYIAIPLLRDRFRPDLSAEEARSILVDAMRVLQYRECRTINRIQFASITADATVIEPAAPIDLHWDISEGVSH
ncbi:MAG: proteasome subunit beta [archaeon]|nr:proteasome subunit beta [archaeon]